MTMMKVQRFVLALVLAFGFYKFKFDFTHFAVLLPGSITCSNNPLS